MYLIPQYEFFLNRGVQGITPPPPPPTDSLYELEDGSGTYLLEDGSGSYKIE